jgi:hypothetical protein
MTDDDRLAALGRLAREEESVNELEERLVRLTHGELSPTEIADLEREADPEALQAHRPLDDEFKKSVESRLEALLPPQKMATVTPIRPRWVMPAAVATLVAAAAAVFFFLNPGATRTALPGYELAVSGGVREVRGATPEPITVGPGSRLTLVARPGTATNERVAAFVFAKEADALTSVPARSESSADGALKLDVAEADLPKTSAPETTLVVIVGRADVVASSEAARALLARGSSPDYQILEARVRRQK